MAFKIVVPTRNGQPMVCAGIASRAEAEAKLAAFRKQRIPAIKRNARWEILDEAEPHDFVVKGRINDKWWWWDRGLSLWRGHPGRGTRLARTAADDTARELRGFYGTSPDNVVVEPAPPPGSEPPPAIDLSLTKRLGIHIG
jgi:hypothetical protein